MQGQNLKVEYKEDLGTQDPEIDGDSGGDRVEEGVLGAKEVTPPQSEQGEKLNDQITSTSSEKSEGNDVDETSQQILGQSSTDFAGSSSKREEPRLTQPASGPVTSDSTKQNIKHENEGEEYLKEKQESVPKLTKEATQLNAKEIQSKNWFSIDSKVYESLDENEWTISECETNQQDNVFSLKCPWNYSTEKTHINFSFSPDSVPELKEKDWTKLQELSITPPNLEQGITLELLFNDDLEHLIEIPLNKLNSKAT
ncbi:hypothetical protein OVS_04010 [Mycoplasma ovis str. Michigan]|uniref:Uncharacterized protein n=1 Tax=Mycoplasma ovis str. Michigan TaxID=1415773 RepID=A0ABM5P294_9MOLU|nr:hypothetical protein [Mycoplasma ovis]AHC40533.1 hypothetical protein OVS_04010 [Mycoplasma ovis str. Michigan]